MKTIVKILKWFGIGLLLLLVVFLLGPKVKYPPVDLTPLALDMSPGKVEEYIKANESKVLDMKPGNEAQIVWADTSKSKTEYSIVYLPGFSATHEEGNPVHRSFAKRYGANLYLARIHDHGRKSEDTFKGLTPTDLIESAKEAIAIGKIIGDKVIVMACSTGGTYAIPLAGEDSEIHSLIMYSPNIDIYDPTSNLVVGPWGKRLMLAVMGDEYNRLNYEPEPAKYWSEAYHTDGILAMKSLIKAQMTKDVFNKVKIPVFLGYYYKSEKEQDFVVSVARMHEFFNQISTPENLKRKVAFPDAGHHVISGEIFSKDINAVKNESFLFAEQVLGLSPVE